MCRYLCSRGEEIQSAGAAIACIILFALLLLLPAFLFGAGGHDLRLQAVWTKLFTAQFWQGDLYPRWLMDMNAGSGTPAFFFYPPIAYFVTALITPLFPHDTFGYYAMGGSAFLAAAMTGIAFYGWMKEETGNARGALIGSLLYMAAPHNIAWNFYYWLLFSSVWAYAWVPLLFMFARRAALGLPYGIAGFAFFLCLLIMTNIPMLVIWGPAAVLYGAMHLHRKKGFAPTERLASATALGFGLSAVFLLPALLYSAYVNIDLHWKVDSANYNHYFLILGFGRLGLGQLVLTIAWLTFALLTLLYSWIGRHGPRTYLFFTAISLAALFLILPLGRPFWDAIFFFKLLQFPERLFTVPSLALAVLATVIYPRMRWLSYALIPLYICAAFTLGSWDTRTTLEQMQHRLPTDDRAKDYDLFMLNIENEHYLTSYDLVDRYHTPLGIAEVKKHLKQVEVAQGDATVGVTRWQPRDIVLHYRADTPSLLRIRQFFFPGMRATMGMMDLSAHREDLSGKTLVQVPSGAGEVHLELTPLLPELLGKEISILAAAVLLVLILLQLRVRHLRQAEI